MKSWVVEITTTAYDNLKISSKQQSGGNNPGPLDWKLQYRPGGSGSWSDIPDAAFQVQNDWTTGVLEAVDLPAECKNQSSLFLRWVMTTNTNSAGNPVEASGINKIDDIIITGQLINTAIPDAERAISLILYPNPCINRITAKSAEAISMLTVTDVSGRQLLQREPQSTEYSVDMTGLPAGWYLIRVVTSTGLVTTGRVMRVE